MSQQPARLQQGLATSQKPAIPANPRVQLGTEYL